MNTFSEISLLLAASSALFLPACGGGGDGDNGDYYISVQTFKTGAKSFYLSASPSATIKADPGGILGEHFSLSGGFMDIFGTNFGQGTGAVEDGERSYGDDSGVYTRGSFRVNGHDGDLVDLGYYTVGGSSGQGYLYIAFQNDNPSPAIAHFMGASMPEDVSIAGGGTSGGDYWVMPDEDARQLLIVSMRGAIMKIVFNFAAGHADVRLCVSTAYKADKDTSTEGGGNLNDHYDVNPDEDAINNGSEVVLSLRRMPFFAVSGM